MPAKPLLPKSIAGVPRVPDPEPKTRGANRSTKVAGKLKLLPDQPTLGTQSKLEPRTDAGESVGTTGDSDDGDDEEEVDEDEEADVEIRLRQISQIPQGTARRDALRLTKKKAKSLPRVTAYATAR